MYSLLVARGIMFTLCWLLGGILYSLLVARGNRVLFVSC